MTTEYRNELIKTVNSLIKSKEALLLRIVNIAMVGEFKDIADTFEYGDVYEFNIEQFKNSNDFNLNNMVLLYKTIEDNIDTIINLNKLEDEFN